MKNTFSILMMLLLMSACQNNTSTEVKGNFDTTGYEVTDIPNSNAQRVVKKSPDGILLEEGIIQNGHKHGMWVTYHTDRPMPKSIVSYVNGIYSGNYMEFSNRGQIEKKIGYLNNEIDGVYGTYKFGRIIETVPYKNGQMDGLYISNFNNSEKIQKEIHYKNGKQHGSFKQYNDDGSLLLEYEYKNGEKISGGMIETK